MVAVTALGAVSAASSRRGAWRPAADARTIRVLAGAATGLAVVLAAVTVVLHLHNGDTDLTGWWFGNAALTVTLVAPAYLVATRRSTNPVGWLLCAACLAEALCGAGREYLVFGLLGGHAPGWLWGGWLADSLYIPAIVTLPVMLMLFPDGQAMSARWRRLVLAVGVAGLVAWLSYLFTGDTAHVRGQDLANPAAHLAPQSVVGPGLAVGMLGVVVGLGAGVVALVVRYRRARGEGRQQLQWVVWAGSLLAVEIVTEFIPGNPVSLVTSTAADALFAAALTVAILRHRMFDIDVVVNRTLVYATLTVLVVGGYVGVVSLLDASVGRPVRLGPGVLATALVAVAFAPARGRVQRAVDRVLYGERHNPYGVLTQLGRQMEQGERRGELTVVVDTVTQALKLPYAAIVDPAGRLLAESGRRTGELVTVPLAHRGEPAGALVVAARVGGTSLGAAERRLLADLSGQVGVAVHAVRLADELQDSRRRLVTAKEEERRRLRRDLHDGLGPKLAAVGLQLDAARSLVADDPDRVQQTLVTVKADIRATLDDVRRLVYDLRPPALDELGLVGAVRDCAAGLEPASGLIIVVQAPEALPPLPAAVEVAAYRILNEALTNVIRHAQASRCDVRLHLADAMLEVSVTDDGVGASVDCRSGVGTQSMAERAAEIGGALYREHPAGQPGTTVTARFPLGRGDD